ncbi:hypothetical protein IAQ61_008224 [Plenodomus lingam]|uniref:Similar to Rik1-associated factor 1 n=1 Tax=Leptosphaeria maculans (strain JN3 / isolate v23.1.3 / race Av1-4-5-6-7-8) TaxID=985895 RepID=E4ZZW4_LEPMJ|nr:similar to Rik1-associated factor 1 [Plenodomus lingam JN3]KAH9867630.1 hypothetical protein IAQ61_008224 [Plenodomus lingam]CBX96824.1 similar to Rik1-associated factor 1 [Plenodomus lingam JN3]
MALSHNQHRVIDLTIESDEDEEATLIPLPGARPQPSAARVLFPPTVSRPATTPVTTARSHPAIRRPDIWHDSSQSTRTLLNISHTNRVTHAEGMALSPKPMGAGSVIRSNVPMADDPSPAFNSANTGDAEFDSSGRATKRMKFSRTEAYSVPHSPRPRDDISDTSGGVSTSPAYTSGRAVRDATRLQQFTEPVGVTQPEPLPPNSSHKFPSVRAINQALKSTSARVPLLGQISANTARAFPIERLPQTTGNVCSTSLGPSVSSHVHSERPQVLSLRNGTGQFDHNSRASRAQPSPIFTQKQAEIPESSSAHSTGESPSLQSPRLSGDGTAARDLNNSPDAVTTNPSPQSSFKRAKFTNQFSEEQDHFLIFLKEVKAYTWKRITAEYNAIFGVRAYHTLQSRYSTVLNKRDRSQDPPILSLPPQFASEAKVDWETIRSVNRGPRASIDARGLYGAAAPTKFAVRQRRRENAPSQGLSRQTNDHDYSSGGDSACRRERPSRAARVNYTLPRQHRRGDDNLDDATDKDFALPDDGSGESSAAVENEEDLSGEVAWNASLVNVGFETADASLALSLTNGLHQPPLKKFPYLSVTQLAALQNVALESIQHLSHKQSLQSCAWHIDFSPSEIDTVERAILKVNGAWPESRHSTRRRQLREVLKGFTEAKLLQLSHELCRTLRTRDEDSIRAFLKDAKAGGITLTPRIHRLAASRPDDRWITRRSISSASIIRERELGRQSARGWRAASKPLTYQVKNKVMDTFGTATSWTGASGDIHAIAWAPNGEFFAAAAVAVDDPHSMQYNKNNNLLFGKCSSNTLHELGEHCREREMTEQGPNSTHAMFASQDPRIYSTVSSLGFSKSKSGNNLLYSAGYDGSICVWHTDKEDPQPILGAKLNVKAPVDMIAVNPVHDGVVAVAVKQASSKAVRLLRINEEDPNDFERHNLHSPKAVARPEMNILPTAIQFEPRFGNMLLAGFGANIRDSGFDTTGDLCLWDVETVQPRGVYGRARNVYGASLNIFDVEFNPNPSIMPSFAIGCVATGNVSRGMRSAIRLYDEREDGRYSCAAEIECMALDMNDVVWCPYDECLVAVGCTDGKSYIWDIRNRVEPLHVLAHGKSVMPLQEGIRHEITDTGVRFLSWGENATRLYSGSSDGVVKVWDVTRSKEDAFIKEIFKADSGIMAGAFSPDYSKLVIGEVNGSVNVLEVGRDDCSPEDGAQLRYVPYQYGNDKDSGDPHFDTAADSGIAEGRHLLSTGEVQVMPMGSLPIRQAVQGPAYHGPYDQSAEAPTLRQQALTFQQNLALAPGPQCSLPACKHNINKTTNEDIGDSGRSLDRIPDSLTSAWLSSERACIVPGKTKCTRCGRPARPEWDSKAKRDPTVLCEHCCFACFRCGAATTVVHGATTLCCAVCAASWEFGTLGYEVVQQPRSDVVQAALDVPPLNGFARAAFLDRMEEGESFFGDEMNALTDYYFSLALDRPESPPL